MTLVDNERLSDAAVRPASRVGFAWLAAATGALYLGVGITIPTLPRFAERSFGASGTDLGLLAVAYTVGALSCRPVVAWLSQRVRQSVIGLGGFVVVCSAFGAAPGRVSGGHGWRISST